MVEGVYGKSPYVTEMMWRLAGWVIELGYADDGFKMLEKSLPLALELFGEDENPCVTSRKILNIGEIE